MVIHCTPAEMELLPFPDLMPAGRPSVSNKILTRLTRHHCSPSTTWPHLHIEGPACAFCDCASFSGKLHYFVSNWSTYMVTPWRHRSYESTRWHALSLFQCAQCSFLVWFVTHSCIWFLYCWQPFAGQCSQLLCLLEKLRSSFENCVPSFDASFEI